MEIANSAPAALRRVGPVPTVIVALLMAAGIFGLRLADQNDTNAILGLLVLPIGLVAARLSWVAGLTAAAIAMALVAAWDSAHDVGLGPGGYLTRAIVFFGTASLVLLHERPGRAPVGRPTNGLITAGSQSAASRSDYDSLSPRELEVLELLARGATNAQIAERFVISEDTVKSHVKHILQKLDVGNRTEAALRYVELFGHPSRQGEAARHTDRSPALGATSRRGGTVVRIEADDRGVLGMDDGAEIVVPVLPPIRSRFEVGSRVLVYFDQKGPVAWYLPAAGLGVDMRVDRDPGISS